VDDTDSMKIACAYDQGVLQLVHHAELEDPVPDHGFWGRRHPYALHLRHRDTGWEFTFVGVHFKSGFGWDDESKRKGEVAHLSTWLGGETELEVEHFERPPTADVLVLGDFNAVWGHASLAQLRASPLEAWHRPEPVVVTSFAGEEPDPSVDITKEHWTTYLDRIVIDHAFAAPQVAARFSDPPCIYAFDRDPVMDDYPSPGGHWLRRATSYRAKPYGGASRQTVANLYRISDHRPLRVSLDPG
jgi:endonuclease/exonuclease/phosphatase family metal-dependent hydrolase